MIPRRPRAMYGPVRFVMKASCFLIARAPRKGSVDPRKKRSGRHARGRIKEEASGLPTIVRQNP